MSFTDTFLPALGLGCGAFLAGLLYLTYRLILQALRGYGFIK